MLGQNLQCELSFRVRIRLDGPEVTEKARREIETVMAQAEEVGSQDGKTGRYKRQPLQKARHSNAPVY
jgi:hypothetical protein